MKTAKTRPVLTETADKIVALLPEDAAATIDAWIKSKGNVTPPNQEPVDESTAPTSASPTAPPPLPPAANAQKKADSSSASALDKQKLDAIINGRPLPPAKQ